jgi:multidrug efflux pump subunit AcrA (membrane-fusion protein)
VSAVSSGIVDLVSPAMDESSRTVKVRVEVANPDGRLLAGMFASVKIFLPGSEECSPSKVALLGQAGPSSSSTTMTATSCPSGRCGSGWDRWVEVRSGLDAAPDRGHRGAFLLKSDVLLEDGRRLRGLKREGR